MISLPTPVLAQLVVLLVAAHAGGRALRSVGQPAVLGQVLGGVLVGPSGAGRWGGDAWSWTWDDRGGGAVVPALASLGAIVLLALAGLDLDTVCSSGGTGSTPAPARGGHARSAVGEISGQIVD